MPLALRMYTEIKELIGEDYEVIFPEWRRGPFGVACDLRGTENLLADIIINPEFVHDLMSFITNARKEWVNDRAKYLGQDITKGDIDDDEVSTPTLSPEQYEEFVLPYEQQLCEFHGGIRYWHSCGDISKLVYAISSIPEIVLFHIGPWTDLKSTRKAFGKDTAFEKCLMPLRDVQLASEEKMADVLDEISNVLEGSRFTVRADGLDIINTAKNDLESVSKWIKIATNKLRVK
jgi:uroporphyrinogen-III decarboxylase